MMDNLVSLVYKVHKVCLDQQVIKDPKDNLVKLDHRVLLVEPAIKVHRVSLVTKVNPVHPVYKVLQDLWDLQGQMENVATREKPVHKVLKVQLGQEESPDQLVWKVSKEIEATLARRVSKDIEDTLVYKVCLVNKVWLVTQVYRAMKVQLVKQVNLVHVVHRAVMEIQVNPVLVDLLDLVVRRVMKVNLVDLDSKVHPVHLVRLARVWAMMQLHWQHYLDRVWAITRVQILWAMSLPDFLETVASPKKNVVH